MSRPTDQTLAKGGIRDDYNRVFATQSGEPSTGGISNSVTRKNQNGTDEEQFENFQATIYYDMLMNSLINIFDYKNVPPTVNIRMHETNLRRMQGYDAIGRNPFGDLVVFRNINVNFDTQNPYGEAYGEVSTDYWGQYAVKIDYHDPKTGKTYKLKQITHENPDKGDFVIFTNQFSWNYGTYNDSSVVTFYARELANLRAQSRLNRLMQRNVFVTLDNTGQLNGTNLATKFMGNQPVIKGKKELDIDSLLKVINFNVPNLMPSFKEEWNNILSECLTYFGINNVGTDKKERLMVAEAQGNDELIQASGNTWLKSRQDALKLLNQRFGLNMSVDWSYSEDDDTKDDDGRGNPGVDSGQRKTQSAKDADQVDSKKDSKGDEK